MKKLKTSKTSFERHAETDVRTEQAPQISRAFKTRLFILLIAVMLLSALRGLVFSIETDVRLGSPSKSVVNEFDPQIAWLASYPNSGTTFTLDMVAGATKTAFATNYGTGDMIPVYPGHPEGPFLSKEANWPIPFGRYILTKTHCGGFCVFCPPDQYAYGYNIGWTAESGISFLKDCASGVTVTGTAGSKLSQPDLKPVDYVPERVSRVIHLIRNPFHNAVSNFHHERNRDENFEHWRKNYPDNYDGMKIFCEEQDNVYFDEEKEFFEGSFFFQNSEQSTETVLKPAFNSTFTNGKSWSEIVAKVPCRGIFFRYVQWHNLFHLALDYAPHKPRVLTVHYENYQTSTFQDTAKSVLEFLELKPVPGREDGEVNWLEFHLPTDYDLYFTTEEKEYICAFLGTLASPRVWGEIQHYFDKINPTP